MPANPESQPAQALVIFVLFVIAQICLIIYLRKKYPGKMPVGLGLCVLFPLFGQLYLRGASWAIILIIGLAALCLRLTGSALAVWAITAIISAVTMHRRLKKAQNGPA